MEDLGYSLFYKSQPSDPGCFYGDYKYHCCFITVYESNLYVYSFSINLTARSRILLIISFDVLEQNVDIRGE